MTGAARSPGAAAPDSDPGVELDSDPGFLALEERTRRERAQTLPGGDVSTYEWAVEFCEQVGRTLDADAQTALILGALDAGLDRSRFSAYAFATLLREPGRLWEPHTPDEDLSIHWVERAMAHATEHGVQHAVVLLGSRHGPRLHKSQYGRLFAMADPQQCVPAPPGVAGASEADAFNRLPMCSVSMFGALIGGSSVSEAFAEALELGLHDVPIAARLGGHSAGVEVELDVIAYGRAQNRDTLAVTLALLDLSHPRASLALGRRAHAILDRAGKDPLSGWALTDFFRIIAAGAVPPDGDWRRWASAHVITERGLREQSRQTSFALHYFSWWWPGRGVDPVQFAIERAGLAPECGAGPRELTPLHLAAVRTQASIAERLVRLGADIDRRVPAPEGVLGTAAELVAAGVPVSPDGLAWMNAEELACFANRGPNGPQTAAVLRAARAARDLRARLAAHPTAHSVRIEP